jgi:hypothetical protein
MKNRITMLFATLAAAAMLLSTIAAKPPVH